MKKTTKGALAAGAAAVLLAGGAGTYAAWTATGDAVAGGTVETGNLSVTQQSAKWEWATTGVTGEFTPGTADESDSIAPGDSVKFTGTYELGIKGSNLTADLVATNPATGTLPSGLSWTPDTSSTLTGLDESANGTTVTVGGTLVFDPNETGSKNEQINLGDIAVTLKQTAPAVAP